MHRKVVRIAVREDEVRSLAVVLGRTDAVAAGDSLAASAAYWIGAQADRFVVTPGGDVGSIGIFAMHEDLTGVADKAGAKVTLIKAGKHKTEGHPFEPLNAESRAAIQARVDDAYARFVAAVAAGRRVSEAAVRRDFGQGRLVGAREALAAGMVDSIETLDQVIDRLRRSPTRSPVSAARHAAGTPPAPRASGVTGQDRAAATCFWQNARLDLLECNVTHAPHDTVQERHR